MKVKFIEVGRNKRSWEARIDNVTYTWMMKQVASHLLSKNIDFCGEEKNGVICAGMQIVGRFEIIDEEYEKLREKVLGDLL